MGGSRLYVAALSEGGGPEDIGPSFSLPQFPWVESRLVKCWWGDLGVSVRTPTHQSWPCPEGLSNFPCIPPTPALATC